MFATVPAGSIEGNTSSISYTVIFLDIQRCNYLSFSFSSSFIKHVYQDHYQVIFQY